MEVIYIIATKKGWLTKNGESSNQISQDCVFFNNPKDAKKYIENKDRYSIHPYIVEDINNFCNGIPLNSDQPIEEQLKQCKTKISR